MDNKLKILEKWVFGIFLFSIPFQTRLILHRALLPSGGFNEWQSFFIYGTDILIFSLLGLWLIRSKFHFKNPFKSSAEKFLLIFIFISFLSIFKSDYLSTSIYQWLKLVEFAGFYLYLRSNFTKICGLKRIALILFYSGLFQAIIAISQYIKQSSLGLRWLGESPLIPGMPGVASFRVGGDLYLRVYGTLPHPNVLGVFLVLSMAGFTFWYFSQKRQHLASSLSLIGYGVILYSLFLTYSRTVIGLTFLVAGILLIILFIKKNYDAKYSFKLWTLLVVTAVTTLFFLSLNWSQALSRFDFSTNEEAFLLRVYYNKLAGQQTIGRPWLGSGIGTFVPEFIGKFRHLPEYIYQPVHNAYLLILTEMGLLGLLSFTLFIKMTLRRYTGSEGLKNWFGRGIFALFLLFLAVNLSDHFLWTLQQGRTMFWIVLAMISVNINKYI